MTTTIIATIEAKPGFSGEVGNALRNMILPTLSEAGCIRYELFCSVEATCIFHLVETYASDEALAKHQQSAHFAELVARLADKLAKDIKIERVMPFDAN